MKMKLPQLFVNHPRRSWGNFITSYKGVRRLRLRLKSYFAAAACALAPRIAARKA
jgi:hypothetical protein